MLYLTQGATDDKPVLTGDQGTTIWRLAMLPILLQYPAGAEGGMAWGPVNAWLSDSLAQGRSGAERGKQSHGQQRGHLR